MNDENLLTGNPATQFNARTAAEAGRKSAASKKLKKSFREAAIDILNMQMSDTMMQRMVRAGVAPQKIAKKDQTVMYAVLAGTANAAANGNAQALKALTEIIGEIAGTQTAEDDGFVAALEKTASTAWGDEE